jgi:hypothetical protein
MLHIGTGMIVDAKNGLSKQMDVVIYDPRFPLMEVESGVGKYLMEGVIATIEVKSQLTKSELKSALANAASVHRLTLVTPNAEAMRHRLHAIEAEHRKSRTEARIHAGCEMFPATYIFAYRGVGPETLSDAVEEWWRENQAFVTLDRTDSDGPSGVIPILPREIVSDTAIGVSHDEWVTIGMTDAFRQEVQAKHGPTGRVMMMFCDTERPLWWLGTHLLHTVCARLGTVHAYSGLRYLPDPYIGKPSMDEPSYYFASPMPEH